MEIILKSTAIVTIFYLSYKIFLEGETFFRSNRYFLNIGLLAALLLPWLVIPIYVTKTAPVALEFSSSENMMVATESGSAGMSLMQIAVTVYFAGFIFFVSRLLVQLASLLTLIFRSEKHRSGSYIYVKISDDVSPFSFFNYIVYNPSQFEENDLKQIIAHEKVHVSQRHSLDLFSVEIMAIINWFNPLVWLYKKDVLQNLEFIADMEAQEQAYCQKTYQHLLLKTTMPKYKLVLANNFYNSLIKKRIVMLHKNRSKNRNQLKIALVLPLLVLFLMSFNTKEIITYEKPELNMNPGIVTADIGDEEVIMITKDMTDKQLKAISEKYEQKGITLKFKGVKRNSKDEIKAIEIVAKTKKSSANYSSYDDEAISPVTITITDNSISIGDDNERHGEHDMHFEIKDGVHKVHRSKDGSSVFVYSSDEEHDEDHDGDHDGEIEIIEDDGNTIIIKNKGNVQKIKKLGKGQSALFISDDDDDEHEVEIIEIKGDDEGKTIIIKKDKDGNIKKEWIEKGDGDSNVWISVGDDDKDENVFKIRKKGDNKLFFGKANGKDPLFILDGKEVPKSVIDDLGGDDIGSIDILKGEAASKKYGDKAKDGVVIITTKN